MDDKQTQTKLAEVLNIESWSEAERATFLQKMGLIVIESAIGRLLETLSEEDLAQLQERLEDSSEEENIIDDLMKTYPNFEKLLQEEAEAVRTDAEKVLT